MLKRSFLFKFRPVVNDSIVHLYGGYLQDFLGGISLGANSKAPLGSIGGISIQHRQIQQIGIIFSSAHQTQHRSRALPSNAKRRRLPTIESNLQQPNKNVMRVAQSSSSAVSRLLVSGIISQLCLLSFGFTSTSQSATHPAQHRQSSSSCCLEQHYCNLHTNIIRRHTTASSVLNLVPFSEAWDTINNNNNDGHQPFTTLLPKLGCRSFNSEGMLIRSSSKDESEPYRLYLATDVDDLPGITKLTLDVFDATAITLSSTNDWSALEQVLVGAVVEPAVGMYNAYAQAVGYTEVLSGLRKRMRNRISDNNNGGGEYYDWLAPLVVPESSSNGSTKETSTLEDIAARSSLILALARPANDSSGEDMEVVASVELRLQVTDGKIPFSQPWLDKVERKLARLIPFAKDDTPPVATNGNKSVDEGIQVSNGSKNPPLRPYLCNLCVSESLRSLGIGRSLCRLVESVARDKWGYSHMYLHVDPSNDAARGLYQKEGYKDVGRRWNAIWAGGANEISYYVKKLG